ncbi:hypothetical protein RHMOL_Rhmol07G0318800 [Rhododendron molle]|uniref:Uncharacterized protein n=1 Tax=Rhododendron molle TaxID=49168 RepID=A0ACC0N6X1_RHOML|nr:hypothetical protein RHMOL_Rhmol07G0318800 [Rhododendron molle]
MEIKCFNVLNHVARVTDRSNSPGRSYLVDGGNDSEVKALRTVSRGNGSSHSGPKTAPETRSEQKQGPKPSWSSREPSLFNHQSMASFNILIWNCRGAGNNRFKRNFSEMLRSHKPEVVALLETKVTLNSMGMFFNSFGLTASTHVDPSGRVGGIWVLWDPTKVTLNMTHIFAQAIRATVRKEGFEEWIFSAIYASPNARLRDTLWEDMEDLATSNQLPWMAAGDFNDVVISL